MAFTGTGLIKQRNNRPIQNFSFVFDGEFSCDLGFTIQLGSQIYRSALSDWSTDLETIRHDLESFVFHRETALQLFFEDSPTIISSGYPNSPYFSTNSHWSLIGNSTDLASYHDIPNPNPI